jgi:hypothetical protein
VPAGAWFAPALLLADSRWSRVPRLLGRRGLAGWSILSTELSHIDRDLRYVLLKSVFFVTYMSIFYVDHVVTKNNLTAQVCRRGQHFLQNFHSHYSDSTDIQN